MRPLDPMAVRLRGTHVIEASAGTGKTYTITSLLLRLLVERDLRIEDILVVTFTDAATAELRHRVRERIRAALDELDDDSASGGDDLVRHLLATGRPVRDRLERALRDFDCNAISTIHGFCARTLRENAFESGAPFDADLEADVAPLFREIATDFWATRVHDADPLTVRYLRSKTSPASLADLAADTAGQPDRVVLPDTVEIEDAPAAFRAAYTRARAGWWASRTAIEELLRTVPGLNRRSYNRRTLPSWLDQVDAYLSPEEPLDPAVPGVVGRFTSTTLRGATSAEHAPPTHPCFDDMEALLEAGDLFRRHRLHLLRQLIDYAGTEHRRRKEERGTHSYDDLLQRLAEALSGTDFGRLAKAIRQRYRAALIDEFQDTDRVQYRIFSRIYLGTDIPMFLIGDPKQSIYAFRGADIFAYLDAVEDAGDQVWTLDVNWRSDPGLIRAVNTLFARGERPFVFDRIGFLPVRPRPDVSDQLRTDGKPATPLRLRFVRRGDQPMSGKLIQAGWARAHLPDRVAADVSRLLASDSTIDGKHISPEHVAVLVRENKQAEQMQRALRRLGVPSVLQSTFSVLESHEAGELYRLMQAVADPARGGLVRSALCTDLLGWTGEQLWELRDDDAAWEQWLGEFRHWRTLWEHSGFIRMLRAVLEAPRDGVPTHARLLGLQDGERRMTNLLHLGELLHAASASDHLGIRGLLSRYETLLTDPRSRPDAAQLRLESDARAVRLVTVHKSKGLEYPLVFCPFLWSAAEGRISPPVSFHDPGDGDRPKLDLGSDRLDSHADLARAEGLAEGLRLLYVALTRARHQCVVYWGGFNGMDHSSLGYLMHRPGGDGSLGPVHKYLKGLDDAQLLADLSSLADDSDGAIVVEECGEEPGILFHARDDRGHTLSCPTAARDLRLVCRTSSFSGLTAATDVQISPLVDDGRDHEETRAPVQPADSTHAPGAPPAHLAGLRGGRLLGTCIHSVFEHLDFSTTEAIEPQTAAQLAAYGLPAGRWLSPLAAAVADTLATPLTADGPRLADIPHGGRIDELPFVFPVQGDPITPAMLAGVFREHGDPAYADEIAALEFAPFEGFLKGFVDLAFEYQERWYVLDYKSNNLGDQLDDYQPDRLADAMTVHHYVLQYHLYVVALHRLLRYRLPDYDYDRDFGGVFYLFVRGMTPGTSWRRGVFRDRPSRALVEALSGVFGEGGPA